MRVILSEKARDLRRSFNWITPSQAVYLAEHQDSFFGFDAEQCPCFRLGEPLRLRALTKRGTLSDPKMPVDRAYLHAGEFEVVAVLKVRFKVKTEYGTNEEVEGVVRRSRDIRNRITLKMADLLRLGHNFSDFEVGYLDENRSLYIDPESLEVSVRGLGSDDATIA